MEAWEALLLSRPPRVREDSLRVLQALGPDLGPFEWSVRLDEDVDEVIRALHWAAHMEKMASRDRGLSWNDDRDP